MKVLVCGGRDFSDAAWLSVVLIEANKMRKINTIVHGAARGADSIAGAWAQLNSITEEQYPADWKRDGKAAGPIRNIKMLAESKPDLVIAFPGGKGTAHMVKIAREKSIPVVEADL